jgi:CubicO group peptidase (beta-lactamase class C family)
MRHLILFSCLLGLSACGAGPAPAPPEGPPALDAAALAHLKTRAAAEKSTALIVLHDGKVVMEEYFGADPKRSTLAMSVTKSVVALGIGALVDRKALTLDEPLSARLFPEWKDTHKAGITTKHLLNHTSGLTPQRYGFVTPQRWKRYTIEAHNLEAAPAKPVGAHFVYNNNAVDLLSVVARRAAPEQLYFDDFLQLALFGPLDIAGTFWSKDAQGDPRGGGELLIRPMDLAKLGQLVLDRGRWQGKQVLSESWIDTMLAQGQSLTDQCGLLWWRDGPVKHWLINDLRLQFWAKAGVDPAIIEKARPLVGRTFATIAEAEAQLSKTLGAPTLAALKATLSTKKTRLLGRVLDVRAYRADGWLGQYIIIVPEKRLVAVRMRDPRRTSWKPEEFSYTDFRWDVLAVAGITVPPEER